MLVNLTDVFTSDGKVIETTCPYEAKTVIHEGVSYPVKECGTVSFRASHTAQGKALAEARLRMAVLIPCDRCLREVEYAFDLHAVRPVVRPEFANAEELDEQAAFMEGYELNIDSLIEDEIVMSWPMKVLCRPDCKGLCPVCGKDLNAGACGCDTFVPDPRMAAIADVFHENKEV